MTFALGRSHAECNVRKVCRPNRTEYPGTRIQDAQAGLCITKEGYGLMVPSLLSAATGLCVFQMIVSICAFKGSAGLKRQTAK